VVITGVSGGLGAALFDEFRLAGDRILALGRRFTEAQHAAERSDPQRIRLRQTDLSYPNALPSAAELSSFMHGAGEVVLINNAAVIRPVGAIGALPADQVGYAVAVNFTAPMLLTNALLGAGVIRQGGDRPGSAAVPLTVVFVSSGAAHRPVGGWAVYNATKRGAEAYFDTLSAQHTGDPQIRVVNVNPGVMDTPMQEALRQYAAGPAYFPDRGRFVGMHTNGELAPPADIARKIIAETLR
jgi:NAD(P)-dependent dehydrogenase (short-subunit alcohol dehydrogenase family)